MRRIFVVGAAIAALALAAPGCGGDDDRLVVYSGRTRNLVNPLLETFSEQTGIKIDVRYADSADLALTIDEAGDRTSADVFISQSPGSMEFLQAAGRLAPLDDGVLGLVDDRFRAGDGTWVGLSGRVRVLVYNTDDVDPATLPVSVLDLVDPAFDGDVAVAPSNGSFQDFVTAMRADIGETDTAAFLDGLAANGARPYANNLAIVQAVGRGEIRLGLVNHYYLYRLRSEDPTIAAENHLFPGDDIGGLLLVTAAAVIDGTDRATDAERLVRFLLAEGAQTFFAEETFEYPLAAGVDPAVDLPALADLQVPDVDLTHLGDGLLRTQELIQQSGLAD